MHAAGTFVGRETELDRVRQRAVSDGPPLTLIVGESGIGKTSLADRALATSGAGRRLLRGRADQHDSEEFSLWLVLLRRLGCSVPDASSVLSAAERRWGVLEELTEALAAAGPATIFLDDLHWADESAMWVLEQLVDSAAELPLAILGASDVDREPRSPRWDSVYRRADVIVLGGLDVADVDRVAREVQPGGRLDAGDLHSLTGGNPLLLHEVLRTGTTGSPGVHALLRDTVERAGEQVAELLALVALSGRGTPSAVLAEALDTDATALQALTELARRNGLLHLQDGELQPRHGLLGETAVARLTAERRRQLHHALANSWRRRPGVPAAFAAGRHAISGLADSDPVAVVDLVMHAAELGRVAGQFDAVARLLQDAELALSEAADIDPAVLARLALDEASARWELEQPATAIAASERALDQARLASDPVLVAEAEVLALRHCNPFAPDPVRVMRLADLDRELPPTTDPGLRARLRGRRAVMSVSLPDRLAGATRLGDEAIAIARTASQPEVLVDAFRDRYFVQSSPDDFDRRAAAAAEIIELATSHGRPQLSLLGLEWSFADSLGTFDTRSALDALDRLEAIAAVMASPMWRYTAAVRRAGLLALQGDADGARQLSAIAVGIGRGTAHELELAGLDVALRAGVLSLYGGAPDELSVALAGLTDAIGQVPLLFAQGLLAHYALICGDEITARRRITPWLGRFDDALRGPEGLGVLGALALVVTALDWSAACAEVIALMQPFAGRLATTSGVGVGLPVDLHIAELSLVVGDVDQARHHAGRAVALARRGGMDAPVALGLAVLAEATHRSGDPTAARSARDAAEAAAEPLGMTLPEWRQPASASSAIPAPAPRRPPGSDRSGTIDLAEGKWTFRSPHGTVSVADTAGLRQLIRLLAAPGIDVSATDLAGSSTGNPVASQADLGPLLDLRAKQEYRRRLAELRREIDEADQDNDIERAARHRFELEALLHELRAAVGLGGRDRPQQSGSERARINVTRNIRRSIAAIARLEPALGAHLQNSVRTGHRCVYAPEPASAIEWK